MYPDFSLLLSVYGGEQPDYLAEALESICASTVLPSQIVLVKDGPLGNDLEEVLATYTSRLPQLEFLPLAENQGLGRALQAGLNACRYEWVARFDTDDRLLPHRFEQQLQFLMQQKDLVLLGGQIQEFSQEGLAKSRMVPLTQPEILAFSKRRNPFNHMTVIFRKSMIQQVGGYQDLVGFEDYYLWLRVLAKGYQVANLPHVLVEVRAGQGLMGRRGGPTYAREVWRAYRRFLSEGLLPFTTLFPRLMGQLSFSFLPGSIRHLVYQTFLRK